MHPSEATHVYSNDTEHRHIHEGAHVMQTSRVQLALNVDDLEEAVEFYTKLFDTEPAKRRPGYANFAVVDPPLKLVLLENQGAGGTLNHLGVEVASSDEVEAHEARLVGAGLVADEEKDTTCCFARQNKFWVTGPDGERWEHYVVLADSETFGISSSASGPGARVCCAAAQSSSAAEQETQMDDTTSIRDAVRRRYAAAAIEARAASSGAVSCCGPSAFGACGPTGQGAFGAALYGEDEGAAAPGAVAASLGCGVPTAVADLHPGEVVLDLGSGAGADVLIAARRVQPGGRAIGLDMTPEMLELARSNAASAGVDNVEFVEGYLEEIPLPDATVDVVISNCVINLAADKHVVLREAARVLRRGGRFAVSDVIADPGMDAETRADMAKWTGCIAGALTDDAYRTALADAGFEHIEIIETHRVHAHAAAAVIRAQRSATPSSR
jgi:SAM-dependent methyltransferase